MCKKHYMSHGNEIGNIHSLKQTVFGFGLIIDNVRNPLFTTFKTQCRYYYSGKCFPFM